MSIYTFFIESSKYTHFSIAITIIIHQTYLTFHNRFIKALYDSEK